MQKKIFYTLSIIALTLLTLDISFAKLEIPGDEYLKNASISIGDVSQHDDVDKQLRVVLLKLLSLARIVVAGFALIYIVLVGVRMITHSDDEGEMGKQKKQILYLLVGFLFLNVPTLIYDTFLSTERKSLSNSNWNETQVGAGWVNQNFGTFVDNIVGLLKVAVLIVAVVMLTWGLFNLIIDRGKGEHRKSAQNIIFYGGAGLLFLGVVEAWSAIFSSKDIANQIGGANGLASKFFGVAFYFAGPVAIFFLMLGAYYYITSMGDESKAKKGKAIIFNTLIATVILLLSYSFIAEIGKFF